MTVPAIRSVKARAVVVPLKRPVKNAFGIFTSGPLVLLKVNGKEPGDEIRLPAGSHTVKVEVDVKSITPVDSIEVMHNGQSLGNVKTVNIDRSGWISVQVKAKYTRDPIRRLPIRPRAGGSMTDGYRASSLRARSELRSALKKVKGTGTAEEDNGDRTSETDGAGPETDARGSNHGNPCKLSHSTTP
jgi:hypothetical protein